MEKKSVMETLMDYQNAGIPSVIMIRHGKKDKTGKHIDPEQIEKIIKQGLPNIDPYLINAIMGTELVRTHETGMAFAIHVAQKTGKIIPTGMIVPEFGNNQMFKKLLPNGVEPGILPIRTAQKSKDYNKVVANMDYALKKLIGKGTTTLVISHTPIVEIMAEYYGHETENPVKELSGFAFTFDKEMQVRKI